MEEVKKCIAAFVSSVDWGFARDECLLQQGNRSFCKSMKAIIMIECEQIYIEEMDLTLNVLVGNFVEKHFACRIIHFRFQ